MRTNNIGTLALVAVAAAVAAWIAVFMYASWISAQQDALASQVTNVQSVADREIAATRLHALARDTQNQRTQLDGLTHTDVIGIANTIDSIGQIAGVKLNIGGATPGPAAQKASAGSVSTLHAVSFVVEADGTFSSLMHAASLLETLPVLSSVESLEFAHALLSTGAGSANSSAWHLTARIRMLTTADISS